MESFSSTTGMKIAAFTDLKAWQESHKLVIGIYGAAKTFPREERFGGLTSQIQEAAVSITSNIAEGFGRTSWKEKAHFYSISMGSMTEVYNQLLIARDVGYIPPESFLSLQEKLLSASKLTKALLKKTQSFG